jgi:hypothetical protein
MPRYRKAREALRLRLLQQRLQDEHTAEHRELRGGEWAGLEIDDEGAPATRLGLAALMKQPRLPAQDSDKLDDADAASEVAAPSWSEPAGVAGRTVVVQYPDGRVCTEHADGTRIAVEPPALAPAHKASLAELFEAAGRGDKEGVATLPKPVGLVLASGCGPLLPKRVVVAAPQLATVEVDSSYHQACHDHAAGRSIRLSSSGMRTRLTVTLSDNTTMAADYDVSVTARINARVRVVRRDGCRIAALASGRVTVRPADAAGVAEEDAEAGAASGPGSSASGSSEAAERAAADAAADGRHGKSRLLEGKAAAEAVPSVETAAGVFTFALGTGEMEMVDAERSLFAVGPCGETVVDVAGAVATSGGKLLFPPLRSPTPPRVILVHPRGGDAAAGSGLSDSTALVLAVGDGSTARVAVGMQPSVAEMLLTAEEWAECLRNAAGAAKLRNQALAEAGLPLDAAARTASAGGGGHAAMAHHALESDDAGDLVGFGAAESATASMSEAADRLIVIPAVVVAGAGGAGLELAKSHPRGGGSPLDHAGGGGSQAAVETTSGRGQFGPQTHVLAAYVVTGGAGAGKDGCGWAGIRGQQVLASSSGWLLPKTYTRSRPSRHEVFGAQAKPTPGEMRRERHELRATGTLDAVQAMVFAHDADDKDSPRPDLGSASPAQPSDAAGSTAARSRVVASLPPLALGVPSKVLPTRVAVAYAAVTERDELNAEGLARLRVDQEACDAWRQSVAASADRFVVRDTRAAQDVLAGDKIASRIVSARLLGAGAELAAAGRSTRGIRTISSRGSSRGSSATGDGQAATEQAASLLARKPSKGRVAIARALREAGGPVLSSSSQNLMAEALGGAANAMKLDAKAAKAAMEAAEAQGRRQRVQALSQRNKRWLALRTDAALLPQPGMRLAVQVPEASPWAASVAERAGVVVSPPVQHADAVEYHRQAVGPTLAEHSSTQEQPWGSHEPDGWPHSWGDDQGTTGEADTVVALPAASTHDAATRLSGSPGGKSRRAHSRGAVVAAAVASREGSLAPSTDIPVFKGTAAAIGADDPHAVSRRIQQKLRLQGFAQS